MINHVKRIATIAVATTAAAMAFAVAAPAQAAPGASGVVASPGGYERCPNGYVCIFDGANGTGKMAYFQAGSQDLRLNGMDNMASSWWNRSGRTFYGYDGYNGDKGRYVFGTEGSNTQKYNLYGSEDNTMSSLYRF